MTTTNDDGVSTRRILRAARQCAVRAGFPLRECRGATLRELFAAHERDGGTVYWGVWTDAELDRPIGRWTEVRL